MTKFFFDSLIKLRFDEKKVAKETFYGAKKQEIFGRVFLIRHLKLKMEIKRKKIN